MVITNEGIMLEVVSRQAYYSPWISYNAVK